MSRSSGVPPPPTGILDRNCTDALMTHTAEMAASTSAGVEPRWPDGSFELPPSLKREESAPPPTEFFVRNSTEELMKCTVETAVSAEGGASVWPEEGFERSPRSLCARDTPPPSELLERNSTAELMNCKPEMAAFFEPSVSSFGMDLYESSDGRLRKKGSEDTNERIHSSFAESFYQGSVYSTEAELDSKGGHWSDSHHSKVGNRAMMSSIDVDDVPPPPQLRRTDKYPRRSPHDDQRQAKTQRREEWLDDFISSSIPHMNDDMDTTGVPKENNRESTSHSQDVIISRSNDEEVYEQYRMMGLNCAYERVRQNLGYHPNEELRQKFRP